MFFLIAGDTDRTHVHSKRNGTTVIQIADISQRIFSGEEGNVENQTGIR